MAGHYLMLEDREVLYFDLEEFIVNIINPDIVPFSMRYAFKNDTSIKSIMHNVRLVERFLSRRVISLQRDNAKSIYAMFGFPQREDIETRVKICLLAKGVSIQDSYWIKEEDSTENFKDVNIRTNKFREIVDVALYGDNPSITTNEACPELTTKGLFSKAWIRRNNTLYLIKTDKHEININTRMEVLASKILSCFSNKIECVEYRGIIKSGKDCKIFLDECKSYAREEYSIVEAGEVMEYCKRVGLSFKDDVLGYSAEASSIGVIDFILSNTDRHDQNYGFKMDNSTGGLIGLAPLYDFNNALVADAFKKEVADTISQMFNDGATIRQVANIYKPYCNMELDKSKLEYIKERNIEFDYIFDKIIERCKYMDIKIR